MSKHQYNAIEILFSLGIDRNDATKLCKISMTLRRWFELECGMDGGGIERDETTNLPYWTFEIGRTGKRGRRRIADREAGAMRRLDRIMSKYPKLSAYIQSDPRGAALYIIRPGDIPEGMTVDSCYNRGIVVY